MTAQVQMELSGSALKARGMAQATDHAEIVSPGWSDRALEMVRRYVREVGGTFQAEEVRAFAVSQGLEEPPSRRAWGGVFIRAKHLGMIRCVGTAPVDNPTAHCANAGLWTSA